LRKSLELGEFRERGTFCALHPLTYRASLVSNVSRDRACETRPRSCGLVLRLVSQGLTARRNSREKIKLSSGVRPSVCVCVCIKNSYLRSYLRKSAQTNGLSPAAPHNTNTQDEPLPPYPQRHRPPSPWKHPPWTRIVSPRLPMSLLQRRDKEGSGGATTYEAAAARRQMQNWRRHRDDKSSSGATRKAAAAPRHMQNRRRRNDEGSGCTMTKAEPAAR